MAISVKKLKAEGKEVSAANNRQAQDAVREFMEENSEHAFQQSEVGAELNMRPQQARQCLIALEKKDVVLRKAVTVPTKNGGTRDGIFWSLRQ